MQASHEYLRWTQLVEINFEVVEGVSKISRLTNGHFTTKKCVLKYSSDKIDPLSCKCSIILGLFLDLKNKGVGKKSQALHESVMFSPWNSLNVKKYNYKT